MKLLESNLAVPVCWLCSAAQFVKLLLVFSVTLMPPVNLGDSQVLTGLARMPAGGPACKCGLGLPVRTA